MGLAETRLDQYIPDRAVCITDYTLYRNDRNRDGGGVAVYVKQSASFTHKLRNDLMPKELEIIVLEIKFNCTKPFLAVVWYRPPDSKMELFEYIEIIMQNAELEDKEIIMMGDINCDVTALNACCYTKRLNDIKTNYHLNQLITEPTRVTESTSTLIDHIYISDVNKVVESGVIHTGISDHSMVYVTIGNNKVSKSGHKTKFTRNYKHLDAHDFTSDLNNVDWTQITKCSDVNDAAHMFQSLFINVCNNHAPIKKKRVRKKKSPWLTDDIVSLIRERDKLKKKAIVTGLSSDWSNFRAMKNKVNYEIRYSKQSYIANNIRKSGKNTKKVWDTIRHVIPNKRVNTNITCMESDKGDVNEPKKVANVLNDYFANVGPNLASKIPTSDRHEFSDDLRLSNEESFKFQPVSESYVLNELKSLPDGKATGTDDLPAKLLKMAATSIAGPVAYLINVSLTTGIFPDIWKSARICPIHKGGDTNDPGNYRPISILPVISKIIERAVFDQLYPFLNSHGIIHDKQSGFRPKHSTMSALLNITEDWYNAIDNGSYVGVVMIDLKKAFDTVNHEVLINKLKTFNIHESSLRWFKNYLTRRKHITVVNGTKSDFANSVCGIPQGSIIGPLLFIMYINDLPSCTSHANVSMYADDTSLDVISNNVDILVESLNQDLAKVNAWLARNKLSLNVPKCEVMVIGSRQRLAKIKDCDLNIHINGVRLKRVHSLKHLGVIIDENMTWHDQVNNIKKKVLSGLYMLKKGRDLFPMQTQSLIFKSVIAPHIDYCDVIWGTCSANDLDVIQKLQNRAAKIITRANWYDSSTNALTMLNWDNIKKRQEYHEAVTMYKIINDYTPHYLRNRFKLRNNKYNLRGYQVLQIPKPNTNFKKRSLGYRGAVSWNSLNDNLKSARNVNQFKKQYISSS